MFNDEILGKIFLREELKGVPIVYVTKITNAIEEQLTEDYENGVQIFTDKPKTEE